MNFFYSTFLLNMVLVIFLTSCGDSECTELSNENQTLKDEISSSDEMLEAWGSERLTIDSLLSQVHAISENDEDLMGEELAEKAQMAVTFIEEIEKRTAQLEKEINSSKNKYANNPVLMASINDLKEKLDSYQQLIDDLTEENQGLKKDRERLEKRVFNQSTTIAEAEKNIAEAQKILDGLNRQINKADGEKRKLEADKRQLNKEKKALESKSNRMYINIARQLIQTAEGLKGGLGGNVKKTKTEMLSKAFDILCDAHKNKKMPEALTELNSLQTNPKLGKLILDKNCE